MAVLPRAGGHTALLFYNHPVLVLPVLLRRKDFFRYGYEPGVRVYA
ncbi:hypothetical protein [Brevibacillus agri]|nr:hypothetical protein [Brevibacillus agri]MED3500997.1 hypothetical protein [Brevibacillus agri]